MTNQEILIGGDKPDYVLVFDANGVTKKPELAETIKRLQASAALYFNLIDLTDYSLSCERKRKQVLKEVQDYKGRPGTTFMYFPDVKGFSIGVASLESFKTMLTRIAMDERDWLAIDFDEAKEELPNEDETNTANSATEE